MGSDASTDTAPVDASDAADVMGTLDSGNTCPSGTCRVVPSGSCQTPSGPLGNGCCGCGADGQCNAHCQCAAPNTRIATPDGEREIAALRTGDLVISMHEGRARAVPVLRTQRVPVFHHGVTRIALSNGRVLYVTGLHPTADGRSLLDLAPGDLMGAVHVESTSMVPYTYDATYDILPDSDTGTYLAEGAWIGSTMRR